MNNVSGVYMSACCPNCGQPITPPSGELVEELRAEARRLGFTILAGGRVREDAAAALLGRSPETLRGWRRTDGRLRFSRDGAGRVTYALADLAAFNVAGENR